MSKVLSLYIYFNNNDIILIGVWAKRYLCMVPHMFLYYYDSGNLYTYLLLIDDNDYFKC